LTKHGIEASSNNIAPDGTKRQVYGPNPKGILILDGSGYFVQIMLNPNRPKFNYRCATLRYCDATK
jgi:hypothetical protein